MLVTTALSKSVLITEPVAQSSSKGGHWSQHAIEKFREKQAFVQNQRRTALA
jgi:hypothetical protein